LIKDVPQRLKDEIQRVAEHNRRSMNQQLLLTLEQVFGKVPRVKPSKPVKPNRPFTHEWLMKVIREGRE
jgi:hypothetical protein